MTCITQLSAAAAAVNGIRALQEKGIEVASLQSLHARQPNAVEQTKRAGQQDMSN